VGLLQPAGARWNQRRAAPVSPHRAAPAAPRCQHLGTWALYKKDNKLANEGAITVTCK